MSQRSVLIIGMGGLGCPSAVALAAAGVGSLSLLDFDRVEHSNLGRQMLFSDAEVGELKVDAAARALTRRFPSVKLRPLPQRLGRDEISRRLVDSHDVVLDGSDNFETRFLANDLCVELSTPLVHGAALGWHGQLLSILPGRSPCLRCIFEDEPSPGSAPSCAEAGVVTPLVGWMGKLMADAALDLLLRGETETSGAMRILEIDRGVERFARLGRDPECRSCAVLW